MTKLAWSDFNWSVFITRNNPPTLMSLSDEQRATQGTKYRYNSENGPSTLTSLSDEQRTGCQKRTNLFAGAQPKGQIKLCKFCYMDPCRRRNAWIRMLIRIHACDVIISRCVFDGAPLGSVMRKHVYGHMRTAKAQIRLRISAVWSGPSFSASRFIGEQKPGWDLAHA